MTRISPMLCERDATSTRILGDRQWIFELKLDGVRIVADRDGDRVALSYRKSRDATKAYPEIADAMRELPHERVVVDGEVVAFDEHGHPNFQLLGSRIQADTRVAREMKKLMARVPVVYVVFDVLVVGDEDLRARPIEERKRVLETIIPEAGAAGGRLRLHPTFDEGARLFEFCREHRLEGVVAKRRGSRYRSGERSPDWIKVKCELEADFVAVGWTEGEGSRGTLGALDLGAYEGGRLVARGSVGSGLDGDTIEALARRLRALEIEAPAYDGKLVAKRGRHFVKPEIVVSVRCTGVTSDGLLRHAVFRGVRPDVRPEEVEAPSWAAPRLAR